MTSCGARALKKPAVRILLVIAAGITACAGPIPRDGEVPAGYSNIWEDGRELIVISAPSVNDPYYADDFEAILDFDIRFAAAVLGRDNIVVLADRETMPRLAGKLPGDILLRASVPDIWIRDFAPVSPGRPVRFSYRPRYLKPADARFIQAGFDLFARRRGLRFAAAGLVLDGGNLVDNGEGRAVVTSRVLEDNPGLTPGEAAAVLKSALGLSRLAIIPEEEGDATGHADGMVVWASADTLLLNRYDEPFRSTVLAALEEGLPGVGVVEVEAIFSPEVRDGFASACGLNVNAVTTERFIYVPVFGHPADGEFLETLRRHTDREVVPVNAESVCSLGGSVRCLSWQVTGENARRLIEAARK